MPRRVAEVGEAHEDGSGVYGIIRDLIVEGKDARFVNKKGRYVVNWSRALDCFADYKAKKNPQFKSKAVSRRKISNGFRSALLNYYKKEGAKEYKDAKKVNENDEVVERQFQMPPRLFKSMFRDAGPMVTEDSDEDDQEDSSSLVSSEGDDKPEVSRSTSTSDTGFDEFMDMSSHEIVESLESSWSVAGNFLTDLGSDVIKTEGEETSVGLSDVQLPPDSQMLDPFMLDSAIDEICSDGISDDISDEGIDLLGVVQDICPTSGSVKGGFQFYISLTEELPDEVKTGVVQFEQVANVMVYKLNPFTLTGTVPSSQVPGEVAVTVTTDAGKKLGMTCFRYIDEMREMVRQIVKDPTLQSLWFAMWSQEHGFLANDSNIAQVLGPTDLQGQDSSVQTKQQQSVKVLQLLVYTAAQTNAREFIEMVFSTSAGQIVFNSYKDRTPLPEDVAEANGHEELAQFLEDINTRLSKETFEDVQSCAIDWLELVKAVQKQFCQDESAKELEQPSDIDDTSDYFADVETSSCGSSDHEIVWTNMSENKAAWKCPKASPILQGPCKNEDIFNEMHPVGTTMSENGPSDKYPVKTTNSVEKLKKAEESTHSPTARPVVVKKATPSKHEAQLDNENVKEGVSYGSFALAFDCISKWWKKKDSGTMAMEQGNGLEEKEKEFPSKSRSLFQGLFWRGSDTSEANVHGASRPDMAKPKECHKRPGRSRSSKKKEAALNYKGIVLTFALLTVLAGFKLKEDQILHWAVGNGYTQFSKMLLQCGVYVDVPGLLKETPLHLAAKNGFKDLVDVLVQSGGNVNARNFPMQETPLHLATRNGHRLIAQFLVQQGSQVNARNNPFRETPLHLASRNGHQQIAEFLIRHGSQVNARNVPWQETPLHLATRNGYLRIALFLLQQGSQVNARNVSRNDPPQFVELVIRHGRPWQETPLHIASRNGHRQIAEVLIQHLEMVNAITAPWEETPLHLAATYGHRHIAEILVKHGSQVNARNFMQETPLHLAAINGHQNIAEFLIQHGGQVNAINTPWKETPLHLAARDGHRHIAEILVKHGSQVDARNFMQETPLHLAAKNGHQYIAEFLIQHGGQVNAINTPWKETPLYLAARDGHRHIAEILVKHGSQVDATNLIQETALRVAVQSGHQQRAELLIHHGSDVNAQKDLKESPLHLAAENGHPSIIHFLIQCGGLVDARNDPLQELHLAEMNGQKLVLKDLIQHGADYKKRNKKKQVPLHLAAQNGHKDVEENFKHKEVYRQKHIADLDGGSDATVIIRHQEGPPLNLSAVLAVIRSIQPSCVVDTRHWLRTLPDLASQYGLQTVAKFLTSFQHRVQNIETSSYFTAQNKEKHVAELLTQYAIVSIVQNVESVPPSWSSICGHGNVRVLINHRRNSNLTSQNQGPHLALKRDRKQGSILIQHNSLPLLASKNICSSYLFHQKFGVTGKYGNDSINGVNTNAFAEPAPILWFAALCTVSVMMLVLLSRWKCHRREHCLRRFSTLPLRENSSQPKTKELLQPISHDKQVKKSAVIGALDELCAYYKSTMKVMSGRSTPTFCSDLGMFIQQEHIEDIEDQYTMKVISGRSTPAFCSDLGMFIQQEHIEDKSTMKVMSGRSTPTFCSDLAMLIQQEHIEVASAERMKRVRTWLECNHGQEEMSSLDSEVVSGPSTVVKERDELFNNKTVDTAGIILIRDPSKRSLAVMKLSLCFQSRGRPVHYLTLKGLTCKTDLKQKLARKRDEAVLIIEQIDQLLASGLPEVTEVVQLLEELLSQNKSCSLELCPQADSEGCLNGDLPALSDKQSTLSMKTMCLKEWKVGQLIQALSITEDLACAGEVQEVVLSNRTCIWPGHFSDENVVLNAAKTVQDRVDEQSISGSSKKTTLSSLSSLKESLDLWIYIPLKQRRRITDLLREDVLVNKFTGTGEVHQTYLNTGAVDEKDLSMEHLPVVFVPVWLSRIKERRKGICPRNCWWRIWFKIEQNEKASARKRQFTETRRVDEMFSALRTIHRWHLPKAAAFSTRTSDCWDIVLTNESWKSLYDTEASLSLVGDLRTNVDVNSSVRDSIAFFSCLPPRLLGEKTESEKISREKVPYLVAEVSAKLKQIFDEIIAEEGSDAQFSEMVSHVAVLQGNQQVQGTLRFKQFAFRVSMNQATKNMDKEFH